MKHFVVFVSEIPSAWLLQEGATLLLTVKDKDRFHEDDIAGEVFVDLNNVLGVDEDISGGFASIPQIDLPLIHGSLAGHSFRGMDVLLLAISLICTLIFFAI